MNRGLVVVAGCLLAASARADTGYFDGDGKTVWLASTANIQMVREYVSIEVHPALAVYGCRFELRNLSDEAVTIQAGFPLSGFHYEGPGHGSAYPCDVPEAEIVAETFGFVARDDDATYHVRYVRHDRDQKFEHLFLWSMTFEPHQTRLLRVGYHIGASGALATTSRPAASSADSPAGDAEDAPSWRRAVETSTVHLYDYVTETAKSWAGPMESADFRIDITQADDAIRQQMSTTSSFLGTLDFGRSDRDAIGPKPVWFSVFPEGSVSGDAWARPLAQAADPATARMFGWHFAPFEPGPRFGATWMAIGIPTTPDGVHAFAAELAQGEHRADILRLVRAQVAAWHGVLPLDAAEQKFVRSRRWFREVPGLTEASLSPETQATLAAIDKLLEPSLEAEPAAR